ncbi:uncharacterized protein LOC106668259 [Cimex lectularius]|uniref:Uncharacterized protein n=1 Tax=Cimex lectularius TaxID=79782 RepID=A0A8I6TIL3_CIMLE|nr:uncharacterized protein LOC106668259 [Cimex lectularius]
MLNIMDLASKYLPDLDKITAGIAKNYSKDDTSTESSYTPQKKVYKSKRPRKKKKKKIVLIKRKLQIPEPPVVPKRVVTAVTRAKQKTAKRKTSHFLKALSSSVNGKETRKETKKRPEKLLKGADVKSGQEGNKAGGIKEKLKKSGAKKSKPSVQMDKALEEFNRRKSQFMASLRLLQQHLSSIDTEQLVAEKSKRTCSEIKSPKKDESIKKTKTEEFPVQKEETSVIKETEECISKESSEPSEKLVHKSQIESEPVPDQIQTSVRKSGYEEFIRTVKLLKKQGLLNSMMKQENHPKNIFPGNFSDSNPSCSSERCPNADYRINKLKSNLTLNNDGPTEKIQLNSHYAQPISFVEYMDKSFEQQTNKEYKNLAQQRALKLKPLFNKSIPVKRQIFDNEYKIEEENAQTGSGDKNKNESIVKSMKSLLPKCTVYRGRH